MAKPVSLKNMTKKDGSGKILSQPKDEFAAGTINRRWWSLPDESIGAAIDAVVHFIQNHQGTRKEQLMADTRMYANSNAFNVMGTGWQRSVTYSNPNRSRICYNMAQTVIDTLVSKVAKNKVTPTFVTNGGVWGMQRKAEQLSKFIEGLFHALDVHTLGMNAFRDACVWGDGFLHIYDDEGEVGIDRVLPHEIEVDEVEAGTTGKPQQMHRTRILDRDILLELFKDDEDACAVILSTSPIGVQEGAAYGTATDLVTVIESYHLKSGKDAKDGVYVVTINGRAIQKTEYDKDYFPFVQISWSKRLLGYFSQGLCEQLAPIQSELNRLLILVQRSLWMGGSFKVLLENGSKVVSQHLNNDVGAIINYTGTPPQYVSPPIIQPEIYQHISTLKNLGYQQAGLSQMSTTGEKPMGVDSGKALRTLTDIEDDRFLFVSQQMEAFYLEVARQCIEVVKDIYSRRRSYEVTFPTSRFLETIDWKDIKLKETEYVMMAFPVSSLSKDIAGRLSDIQELTQAGMMTPRTARKLMSMPDVEMSDKLANAAENLICDRIEKMLQDDGKYKAPEPTMDLVLARVLCLEYINYAELNNAPEDRLKLLRRFLDQLGDLTGTNAPGPMQGAGAAPPANPTATPTSNLVPNVNGGSVQ